MLLPRTGLVSQIYKEHSVFFNRDDRLDTMAITKWITQIQLRSAVYQAPSVRRDEKMVDWSYHLIISLTQKCVATRELIVLASFNDSSRPEILI